MEAPELAQAYAAAWQEGVQAGVLPEVSANEDGTFTVRERGKAGKEGKVLVLTPAAADAYLQTAIAREEEAQFEQLKKELGEQGAREKAPNLRAMVQIGVSEIAGEAMRRQVAEHGRFDVADVEKQLPEYLAKLVRMRGGIDRMLAARISDWARGRVAALMEGGMSEHDAWASKDYAAGAVRSLGDWTGFAESFVHRTEKLANRDSVVTQVFRAQNNDVALTVLGSTIFNVRGKGRAFGWLEDTTESVVDQLIQARGVKLYEAKKGGLGEMVLPFVTLGTDIYREVLNIDKDAPLDKHWATVGRLLRSLGSSAAIFHESTTGSFANASSIAAAAAVAGNMSMVVKGLIKAMEDAED